MSAITAKNHTDDHDDDDDDVNSSNANVLNSTPHESRTNASQIDEHRSFGVEEFPKSFNENSSNSDGNRLFNVPHRRVKRIQIFRPLFVYRQEKMYRQQYKANRRSNNNKQKSDNGLYEKQYADRYDGYTKKPGCRCNFCASNTKISNNDYDI